MTVIIQARDPNGAIHEKHKELTGTYIPSDGEFALDVWIKGGAGEITAKVDAPEDDPLSMQPEETLVLEAIKGITITPAEGPGVPMSAADVARLFDKDKNTGVVLPPLYTWTVSIKKPFPIKYLEATGADNVIVDGLEVTVTDIHGVEHDFTSADMPIKLDYEIAGFEIHNPDIESSVTICEIIGKIYYAREVFYQSNGPHIPFGDPTQLTREEFKEPFDAREPEEVESLNVHIRDIETLTLIEETEVPGGGAQLSVDYVLTKPEFLSAVIFEVVNSETHVPITVFDGYTYQVVVRTLDGANIKSDIVDAIMNNGIISVEVDAKLVVAITLVIQSTAGAETYTVDMKFHGRRSIDARVEASEEKPLNQREVRRVTIGDLQISDVPVGGSYPGWGSGIMNDNNNLIVFPLDTLLDGDPSSYLTLPALPENRPYRFYIAFKTPMLIDEIKFIGTWASMHPTPPEYYQDIIGNISPIPPPNGSRFVIHYANGEYGMHPIQQFFDRFHILPQRKEIIYMEVFIYVPEGDTLYLNSIQLEKNTDISGRIHAIPEQITDIEELAMDDLLIQDTLMGSYTSGLSDGSGLLSSIERFVNGDYTDVYIIQPPAQDPVTYNLIATLKKPRILEKIELIEYNIDTYIARIMAGRGNEANPDWMFVRYVDNTNEILYVQPTYGKFFCIPQRKEISQVYIQFTMHPTSPVLFLSELVLSTRGNKPGVMHARPSNVTDIKELTIQDILVNAIELGAPYNSGVYRDIGVVSSLDVLLDGREDTFVLITTPLETPDNIIIFAALNKPRIIDEIKLMNIFFGSQHHNRVLNWSACGANGQIVIGYADNTYGYEFITSGLVTEYRTIPERKEISYIQFTIGVAAERQIALSELIMTVDTGFKGDTHGHPENITDVEELTVNDFLYDVALNAWSYIDFNSGAQVSNLTPLVDGDNSTYVILDNSIGEIAAPVLIHAVLKKPRLIEEIELIQMFDGPTFRQMDVQSASTEPNVYALVVYDDGSNERINYQIPPNGYDRIRFIPTRKNITQFDIHFYVAAGNIIALSELICRLHGVIGRQMAHPLNVTEQNHVTKQDVLTDPNLLGDLGSYISDGMNYFPIDKLLDSETVDFSSYHWFQLLPNTTYDIQVTFRKPMMIDEVKLIGNVGLMPVILPNPSWWQAGSIPTVYIYYSNFSYLSSNPEIHYIGPNYDQFLVRPVNRLQQVYKINIHFVTGNIENVSLSELIILKGKTFEGRDHSFPTQTKSVEEITIQDVMHSTGDYGQSIISGGDGSYHNLDKLLDGRTTEPIILDTTQSQDPVTYGASIYLQKPRRITEFKLIGSFDQFVAYFNRTLKVPSWMTNPQIRVVYADGGGGSNPYYPNEFTYMLHEGDEVFIKLDENREVAFINFGFTLAAGHTVYLNELILETAHPRLYSPHAVPIHNSEVDEVVLSDVVPYPLAEDFGGTSWIHETTDGFFYPLDKVLDGDIQTWVELYGGVDVTRTWVGHVVLKKPRILDEIKLIGKANLNGFFDYTGGRVLVYNDAIFDTAVPTYVYIYYADGTNEPYVLDTNGQSFYFKPQQKEVSAIGFQIPVLTTCLVNLHEIVMVYSKAVRPSNQHEFPVYTELVDEVVTPDVIPYTNFSDPYGSYISGGGRVINIEPLLDGKSTTYVRLDGSGEEGTEYVILLNMQKPRKMELVKLMKNEGTMGTVSRAVEIDTAVTSGHIDVYYSDSYIVGDGWYPTVKYIDDKFIMEIDPNREVSRIFIYLTVGTGGYVNLTELIAEYVTSVKSVCEPFMVRAIGNVDVVGVGNEDLSVYGDVELDFAYAAKIKRILLHRVTEGDTTPYTEVAFEIFDKDPADPDVAHDMVNTEYWEDDIAVPATEAIKLINKTDWNFGEIMFRNQDAPNPTKKIYARVYGIAGGHAEEYDRFHIIIDGEMEMSQFYYSVPPT